MIKILTETTIKSTLSTLLITPGFLFLHTSNLNFDLSYLFFFSAIYIFVCFTITQQVFNFFKNK